MAVNLAVLTSFHGYTPQRIPAALVLYAVFGSSRHLVVGPMAATAALSAAAIAEVADDRDALALTAGSAGATSQLSGVFVAALTVVTLLFLTGLFENLPEATLAAVVVAAAAELVDIEARERLGRVYFAELGQIYGPATRADLIAARADLLVNRAYPTVDAAVHAVGAPSPPPDDPET